MSKQKISVAGITKNSTLGNKTGAWRSFRPIVTDRCTGCGICVQFCPEGCMELVDRNHPKFEKKVKINYDYCKGCLICMNECPFKAIEKTSESDKKEK